MAVEDLQFWKIVGGTAREILEQCKAAKEEKCRQLSRFHEKWGVEYLWYVGENVRGIVVDDPKNPPEGWMQKKGHPDGHLSPDGRRRKGKDIKREMNNINKVYEPRKAATRFFESGDPTHIDGRKLTWPTFGHLPGTDDEYVVACHKNATVTPVDGLEPMKASEYLAYEESASQQESA